MPVIGVHIEEVQFDVPFGAEKYLLAAVGALTDIIPFEFVCETYQRFGDIEEVALGEMMLGYFFLLDSLLKGEIVVINVTVEHLMFDTKLGIWNKDTHTFFNLAMVYFSHISMLYILELIHQSQIFVHSLFIIDVVFFVIHEVFVGGIYHVIDIYFSEEGMFGTVYWLYFICYVGVGS